MFAKLARFYGLGRRTPCRQRQRPHVAMTIVPSAAWSPLRSWRRGESSSAAGGKYRRLAGSNAFGKSWRPTTRRGPKRPGMSWMTGRMRWSVGAYMAGKLPFRLVVSLGLRSTPPSCHCHG